MKSSFRAELARLKTGGLSSLVSEVESLLEASEQSAKPDTILARKFLALAAQKIQAQRFQDAHYLLGASVEAHLTLRKGEEVKVPAEVKASLDAVAVAEGDDPFFLPLPKTGDGAAFNETSQDVVSGFADLLLNAGFAAEAKAYLEAYNGLNDEVVGDMSKKEALKDLSTFFKRQGNPVMAKAAEELMEKEEEEEMALPPEEPIETPEEEEEMKVEAKDTRKVLHVESASREEIKLKNEATASLVAGNMKKAHAALVKAEKLERMRLVAALIKADDLALAMEGLAEDDEVPEEKNAGMYAGADGEEATKVLDEEAEASMEGSDLPDEALLEQPSKEPEVPAEEPSEAEMANEMKDQVMAFWKANKRKAAVIAFAKLNELENEVVAHIAIATKHNDKSLVKEGKPVWKAVRKARLTAEAFLAKAESEQEAAQEAMEGMKMLENEAHAEEELQNALDQSAGDDAEGDMHGEEAKAEELTKDVQTPPGGVDESLTDLSLDMPVDDDGGEEEVLEEEADSMHYEVLQSVEGLKGLKIDREALAFTYWEDDKGGSPYYVVQAAGKPIGEIHLADQANPEEIRAYFCDEQKYTQAVAQTVENTSLFEMLKSVNARFYANAVDKSAYADKLKKEALASLTGVRAEKLGDLRSDLMDALLVSAEALNKGLLNKPHALKAAFVRTLASYGLNNPALIVEAAFKEAGEMFFEQVLDHAKDYLEMPKEAYAHTKKFILNANNMAFASANSLQDQNFGSRLSANSVPFASVPDTQEAPAYQYQEARASFQRNSESGNRDELKRKLGFTKR